MRILLDGSKVEELNEAKTLTVYTKCPQKWKLIDMETGEEYIGYNSNGKNDWKKLNNGNTQANMGSNIKL